MEGSAVEGLIFDEGAVYGGGDGGAFPDEGRLACDGDGVAFGSYAQFDTEGPLVVSVDNDAGVAGGSEAVALNKEVIGMGGELREGEGSGSVRIDGAALAFGGVDEGGLGTGDCFLLFVDDGADERLGVDAKNAGCDQSEIANPVV